MSPEKMRTIARKENRCIIEVQSAKAKVISIARQKCNAKGVRKRRHAPEDPIGDCLFIGRSRRDKWLAVWWERQNTVVPKELATRSRLCLPSSNNRLSCAACDCDDYGTSPHAKALSRSRHCVRVRGRMLLRTVQGSKQNLAVTPTFSHRANLSTDS